MHSTPPNSTPSEFTVFYAWQSDAPRKLNHDFIREAAEIAFQEASGDILLHESPRLDHDTKDVPGTPEVASTVFRKIRECGAFLADVTLVGTIAPSRADKSTKKTPNPNVLIELGYAAAKVGWECVVCVMNTYYGGTDEQLFDIRNRRFPICYEAKPDSPKEALAKEKRHLAVRLREAVSLARYSIYEAVQDVIDVLDINSIELMRRHGHHDVFWTSERNTMGQLLANQLSDAAVVRLLSLKVIRCDNHPSEERYVYYWTYLGRRTLEKLGFRLALEHASTSDGAT